MFDYHEPLFRPPSEALSLIFQVTLGCSHNRCSFCSMYRGKRFRPRPQQEIEQEIAEARDSLGDAVRRVFLADGDPFCLSSRRLLPILQRLQQAFPRLERVSCYTNARDILSKSDEELRLLRQNKLRLVYMGLESGDEETLARVNKGATAEQMIEAVLRAKAADIGASVMVLLGIAGIERSQQHARASAEVVSQMAPDYTALLSVMPTPHSELYEEVASGAFSIPEPEQLLREAQTFLQGLHCQTYFTCNHASNYLPLKGHLPQHQHQLLALVEGALSGDVPLKPELLRGL